MIFETHAHYDDDRFKDDRDETIKRVHEKGVAPIINVGASIGSTMTTIELAKKYDFIYAAYGFGEVSDKDYIAKIDSFEELKNILL